MRGVSRWATRVTPLLAAFFVLGAASAWADEPPPTDPPEARAQPPVGVSTQARAQPPVGIVPPPPEGTPQARLGPPVGVNTQARMNPPVGATARLNPPSGAPMTLAQMILMWLQSRISIPNG